MNDEERTLLESGLRSFGIQHNEEMVRSFSIFLDELILWNSRTNLVGTSNRREILVRHILDSLAVIPLLKNWRGSILDIGAGAGFPSIPVAIVRRDAPIHAVERREKRAAFMNSICTILGLTNVTVVGRDVRDVAGKFDVILARGVGELARLYRLSERVKKESAMIIAFKGKINEINREVARLRESTRGEKSLRLRIERVRVPHLDREERNIVIIETE